MSELDQRMPRHAEGAEGRILDGEAVVVTIADGLKHDLNPVGTLIWSLSDGAHTVAQIAEAVVEAWEVTPEVGLEDTETFVARLVELGILELD